MKRVVTLTIMALLATLLATLVGSAPAEARSCPPSSVGGKTVAVMKVRGKTVPVKRVTFRNGGALLPPATNQAAGISVRNARLNAKRGSTVITWHVRYGVGCNGTLNALITMPIGSTFTVGAVGKTPKTYQISKRVSVPKGRLKRAWFRSTGRHRLVMLTCDDYAGGVFRRTMAIIAKPIPTPPPAPEPTAPAPPAAVPQAPASAVVL